MAKRPPKPQPQPEPVILGPSPLRTSQAGQLTFEHWSTDHGYYFHIRAANHEIVAPSEGYHNRVDMLATVDLLNPRRCFFWWLRRWPVIDLDAK